MRISHRSINCTRSVLRYWAWLLCAGLLLVATQTTAAEAGAASVFPRPASLEAQVNFWRQIFGVYSRYQMVFHDDRWPGKIYKVLDFRPLVKAGASQKDIWLRMRDEEQDTKIRIQAMLWHIYEVKADPSQLNTEEQRIVRMFDNVRGGSSKFVTAQHHLRSQRGLKEKTRQAIIRSGRYMDHMVDIFRQYKVPVQLTRLPLVESSFNAEAYSKVGAAGLWQFMPGTAKDYMRYNRVVDDRRDPWYSTKAAAEHLRDSYAALGDWALAVTAYNHGRAGVARAVAAVGSSNIADLVHNYSSDSFGFASRNFYTEFLAAVDVYRNRVRYFGPIHMQRPGEYDLVATRDYVNFSTLAKLAGVSEDRLAALNPALKPIVLSDKLRVPPQSKLRVPAGDAQRFEQAYAALDADQRHDQQRRIYVRYRVTRGDNLGYIAQLYGISVSQLKRINGMRGNRIRIGQRLRVPAGRQPRKVIAAAATHKASVHVVQRGESLWDLAQRYGTSVAAIKRSNHLNSGQLRIGQRLQLTGAASAASAVVHTVHRGDSLGEIAQHYGTSVTAIKRLNDLRGNRIRIGQQLRIEPGRQRVASVRYQSHRVSRGQTLSEIAAHYNTSVQRLRSVNGLAGNTIRVGQTLKIPSS